ncbi:hypothetical protein HPP92_004066 [Vanilla planifolia]|uniref:Uncharacterized protein n=1 Tax=Vanilla planifolia TaxID=51239 RepID=A0A835VJJ9_VANPL|nr:hypothetical protein HPP92_004066 [Vanilla planifolia]
MERKEKRVLITVYEAPAKPQRSHISRSDLQRRRPAGTDRRNPHSFDRRALLLSYAHQLRRIHSQSGDSESEAGPDWGNWKATFATKRPSRWGFRVLDGTSRRPRLLDYERVPVVDDDGGRQRKGRFSRASWRWREVGLISKGWRLSGRMLIRA